MSITRLLLPVLSQLLGSQKPAQTLELATHLSDLVVASLRKEIYKVSLKILAGVVLAAVVTYSVVVLLMNARAYTDLLVDGRMISTVAFALLAIISSVGIWALLRSEKLTPEFNHAADQGMPTVNTVVGHFAEGFLSGFQKVQNQNALKGLTPQNPPSRDSTADTTMSSADREFASQTAKPSSVNRSSSEWNESLRDRRDFA